MAKTLLYSTPIVSSTSSLAITSGIDSTYDIYEFYFINIHPSSDGYQFKFQVGSPGSSLYNKTILSNGWHHYQLEIYTGGGASYSSATSVTNGTIGQPLSHGVGNNNDESVSGILTLYSPSSTTYMKRFMYRSTTAWYNDGIYVNYGAGHIDTTSAIDKINFLMTSGYMDNGRIHMYGVS